MHPILQGLLATPLPAPAAVAAVLAAVALAGLLVLPFRLPTPQVEAGAALVAAAVVLVSGAVAWPTARPELHVVLPVVVFLVASLVVAERCAAAGVFDYLGDLLRRRGGPTRVDCSR